MKKYSLAKCKNNPLIFQVIEWNEFEKEMRKQNIVEAIMFPVENEATEANLPIRYLIGEVILAKDGVKHMDDYCLIDHEDNNRLLPCLILLDPVLDYALVKALEFRDNKSIIQCVIVQKNNQFHVNECELVKHNKSLNHLLN